jgi:hypothetical protein
MGKLQWSSGLGIPIPDRVLTADELELLLSSQLLTSNKQMPGSDQLWEAMVGLSSVLATAEKIAALKGVPVKVGANQGAGYNANDATESNIIHIDRSTPFNPATFIGKGWTIKEQDERSLALTELDLIKIKLETTLEDIETSVRGEEKLLRLKAMNAIRLDARIAQILYEDPFRIPEEWKKYFIYFDGTILRNPDGDRYVLCLYWNGHWEWNDDWLEEDCEADSPSAVLAAA